MKFYKHLQTKTVKAEALMSESKGILKIFGDFWKDMKQIGAVTKASKKAADEMKKKVDSLTDKDGTIAIADANRILDEYISKVTTIAKNSGMKKETMKAFLDGIKTSAQKSRKSWS